MVLQNQEIDRLRLPRIYNDTQLHQLIDSGELVRIPDNETLVVLPSKDRRYCRPWTRNFIVDMGYSFFHRFNKPLVVDSAVRTVEQQHDLRRYNKYAALETGETPSSHLAGITIDIAKQRYNRQERQWIIRYLSTLQEEGFIIPTEEPLCFHVAVREKYMEIVHK